MNKAGSKFTKTIFCGACAAWRKKVFWSDDDGVHESAVALHGFIFVYGSYRRYFISLATQIAEQFLHQPLLDFSS